MSLTPLTTFSHGAAMKYLKSAKLDGTTFAAKFTNGQTTESHDAATFFMKMEDKGTEPDELNAYIRLGMMVDPSHDWIEIKRIAATFLR